MYPGGSLIRGEGPFALIWLVRAHSLFPFYIFVCLYFRLQLAAFQVQIHREQVARVKNHRQRYNEAWFNCDIWAWTLLALVGDQTHSAKRDFNARSKMFPLCFLSDYSSININHSITYIPPPPPSPDSHEQGPNSDLQSETADLKLTRLLTRLSDCSPDSKAVLSLAFMPSPATVGTNWLVRLLKSFFLSIRYM